ncbi:MAG TPA: hypothetical protein PKY89_16455 [Deltaproteobacteria bacterium]|nr:hypothetical protein [Deltaproteobacteria bacterium]
MKLMRMLFMISMTLLLVSSAAFAGDFDWIKDFNIKAEADPDGFRARLAARFDLGDVQIKTVLGNIEEPADAYMVLRLGEMSGKPTDHVMRTYKSAKGQGWGALAKSLGIKPGSKEFQALKNNCDLYDDNGSTKKKGKGKGKK